MTAVDPDLGAETTPARLRRLLEAGGRPWPGSIEHMPVVDSTNEVLKQRARNGAPSWSVVLADEQRAGRGRHGRVWSSPPGGLYLSVLLHPPAAVASLVPLAAGIAVAEALDTFSLRARLKWPNDAVGVLGKVAGVLAEASSSGGGIDFVVLGVGVNVDPEGELPQGASSVKLETGSAPNVVEVARAVLSALPPWYDALVASRIASILAEWRRRAVPWWGRAVEVRSGDRVLRGILRDVDDEGALLVDPPEGGRIRIVSGEVRELRLGVT